jgi:four helix bundle protein
MTDEYHIVWSDPDKVQEPQAMYDLEERLEDFGVSTIDMVDGMTSTKGASHLGGQVIRSATAPALIYGEAQAAESRRDFIHKMKIILKELRETRICLRMMEKAKSIESPEGLPAALSEVNQLIPIFYKSIKTAERNAKK